MSEEVKFLYVSESNMPDCVMVGSIARSRADDMVRYVPERTCHIERDHGNWLELSCDHCVDNHDAVYCPYCGAKVVDE